MSCLRAFSRLSREAKKSGSSTLQALGTLNSSLYYAGIPIILPLVIDNTIGVDRMDAKMIGRRIQIVRKERGLTQEQLSQAVGLSPNYLSNIETGLKTPKLETFIEIVNALHCDANTLLADVVDSIVTQESSQVSKALSELPVTEQRRIMKIVEMLVTEAKNDSR